MKIRLQLVWNGDSTFCIIFSLFRFFLLPKAILTCLFKNNYGSFSDQIIWLYLCITTKLVLKKKILQTLTNFLAVLNPYKNPKWFKSLITSCSATNAPYKLCEFNYPSTLAVSAWLANPPAPTKTCFLRLHIMSQCIPVITTSSFLDTRGAENNLP